MRNWMTRSSTSRRFAASRTALKRRTKLAQLVPQFFFLIYCGIEPQINLLRSLFISNNKGRLAVPYFSQSSSHRSFALSTYVKSSLISGDKRVFDPRKDHLPFSTCRRVSTIFVFDSKAVIMEVLHDRKFDSVNGVDINIIPGLSAPCNPTFDSIKAEKANATSRYQRIQHIATLFRIIEFCVLLIIASKFSSQISFPSNLSAEYLRGIAVAVISPRFVFLVGNAIVLVLFFKSGRFSGKDGEIADFYDEYVEKCGIRNREREVNCDVVEGGKMRRSSSEKIVVMRGDTRRRELTRSVTEGCRSRRMATAAEEMSSEEFRRTVEAFIARQQRFLREED